MVPFLSTNFDTKHGCQRAAIRKSAVVLRLLFKLFLTNLRQIQSNIPLTSRKKTLMKSSRQGRSTTPSFTHRSAPFAVEVQRIDRIVRFWLARTLRAWVPYARLLVGRSGKFKLLVSFVLLEIFCNGRKRTIRTRQVILLSLSSLKELVTSCSLKWKETLLSTKVVPGHSP